MAQNQAWAILGGFAEALERRQQQRLANEQGMSELGIRHAMNQDLARQRAGYAMDLAEYNRGEAASAADILWERRKELAGIQHEYRVAEKGGVRGRRPGFGPRTTTVHTGGGGGSGLSTAGSDYETITVGRESGGRDTAKNPLSSALGPHQFLEGTWNEVRRNHPELGLSPNGRTDRAQSSRAFNAFTRDNADILAASGLSTQDSNLYAAHFLGANGAVRALSMPDNTPMYNAVDPATLRANPHLKGMNVGDFKRWTQQKYGTASTFMGGGDSGTSSNTPVTTDQRRYPVAEPGVGATVPVSDEDTDVSETTTTEPEIDTDIADETSGYSMTPEEVDALIDPFTRSLIPAGKRAVEIGTLSQKQFEDMEARFGTENLIPLYGTDPVSGRSQYLILEDDPTYMPAPGASETGPMIREVAAPPKTITAPNVEYEPPPAPAQVPLDPVTTQRRFPQGPQPIVAPQQARDGQTFQDENGVTYVYNSGKWLPTS